LSVDYYLSLKATTAHIAMYVDPRLVTN